MSLIGLQAGLAALIRIPSKNRAMTTEAFLAQFDLTPEEHAQLLAVSGIPQVETYGLEQADQRWDYIQRYVTRLFAYVPARVLRNLWFEDYEPTAMRREVDLEGRLAFSSGFLEFLATSRRARQRLTRHAGAWILDLLLFERAEIELKRPVCDDPGLAAGSCLKHGHFRLLDLSYDIPAILGGQVAAQRADARRPVSLLLLRRGILEAPRIFEIEAPMRAFLLGQLGDAVAPQPSSEQQAMLAQVVWI